MECTNKLLILGCDPVAMLWQQVLENSGLEGEILTVFEMQREVNHKTLRKRIEEPWDLCIVYGGHSDAVVDKFYSYLPKDRPSIPVGMDVMGLGMLWTESKVIEQVNQYLLYGGRENFVHLVEYLECFLEQGDLTACILPKPLPFEGLFFPEEAEELISYDSLETYEEVLKNREAKEYIEGYVGLFVHRDNWIHNDLAVVKALEKEFAKRNLHLICVFHNGIPDEKMKNHSQQELMERYFKKRGQPIIEGLVNLSIFGILAKEGRSVYEESVLLYCDWNIPIFYPLIAICSTYNVVKDSQAPLASELVWQYLQPEMQGLLEPVFIACKDENWHTMVLEERLAHFVARASKWIVLRRKKNCDKKLAIVLHNAVCSGVEASVGLAYGLDAFESVVSILNRLQEEGYDTGNIPKNGKALYESIREHKAISDFRWTAVEDIVENGGALYLMDCEREYLPYFHELDKTVAKHMEETWGAPPGEGMVIEGKLVITGLRFGNVLVMVQPKRGCHKAKCTGEVCKILHDPMCPPPHQYLATYRYIQDIFGADAYIGVGTEGSIEYLPGKSNGISKDCWPDIVIGELPHLYLYYSGSPSQAVVAKRRSYAALLSYLPMPRSEGAYVQLNKWIEEYRMALQLQNGQEKVLAVQIQEALKTLEAARKVVEAENDFLRGLEELQSLIKKLEGKENSKLHIYGTAPELEECLQYVEEVWKHDEEISRIIDESGIEIRERILQAWKTPEDFLDYSANQLLEGLKSCVSEMDNLITVLNGGYLPPSECGTPDENGLEILPTGRNLYQSDASYVPTRTAWQRGMELANQLIELYVQEEGALPEKVAMNMMSLDISRCKGEQFSQFLYLMGIRPVWNVNGRVVDLEVISLEELKRPRIDVTVRITGVLRDSYPDIVEMMDKAVILAGNQEESHAQNYVRKNMQDMDSSIRIFGDAPGTYGTGIDLALMASAWESEEDLMRYYIKHSAYAYGKDLHGETKIKEFIDNIKKVDISYDLTSSKRTDVLECGFGTQVQGGMRLIAKHLGNKRIRQYQGMSQRGKKVQISSLSAHYQKAVEETLLNPLWREEKKKQGYQGASNLMFQMQNVFMDQCLNELLADSVIDRIVENCVNAEDMQEFFRKENPYAIEETARRFLELSQRGKWQANPEVLARLQESYLEAEADMEVRTETLGEIQGGSVEIQTDAQVDSWRKQMEDVDKIINEA